jgi:hypothetical protein
MLIAEYADMYEMALTKKTKMRVVMMIVDIVIARGGRFLINNNNGTWSDGGRKHGKKKTGCAFCDALRGRVKCISQMRERLSCQPDLMTSTAEDHFSDSWVSTSSDELDLEISKYFKNEMDATIDDFLGPIELSDEWSERFDIDGTSADDLLDFFTKSA